LGLNLRLKPFLDWDKLGYGQTKTKKKMKTKTNNNEIKRY